MSFWKLLWEDLSVPYERDPAINTRCEMLFNYPGVWAVVWYRFANRLYRANWKRLARIISGLAGIICSVDIHPAATIGRRLFIDHAYGVVIGETAEIGDDVTIYQGVTLGGVELSKTKRHPTLENGVVVGAGAKVLGNITLGENAKIGANSVVVRDVPAECTAVGIPAKTIIKGNTKSPLAHNKLPDIEKEIFGYLLKRLQIVEDALLNDKRDIIERDEALDKIYDAYLDTMKK